MTTDELATLVERLLDNDLAAHERDALANRLTSDVVLRERLTDELALALQVRAALTGAPDTRAELLMASLSGSRRLRLGDRIDAAITLSPINTPSPIRRPWLGVALTAAALAVLVIGWWILPQRHATAGRAELTQQSAVPRPPTAEPFTRTPDTVDQRQPTAPTSSTTPVEVTRIQPDEPQPVAIADPAPAASQVEAPSFGAPTDGAAPSDPQRTNEQRGAVVATQASPKLPQPDPKALRLTPALQLNGNANLKRQDRIAPVEQAVRVVAGDEVTVTGDGAELSDERGMWWWAGPGTCLSVLNPRPVDAQRQPLHLTTGTLHITATQGLRPLLTTPHVRISCEEADLWVTVFRGWTRIETISGTVHLGTSVVRPLAPGNYAVVLPGQPPQINAAGRDRWSVIGGRLTRDGVPFIARLVDGVEVATAVELGADGLVAPADDGRWLDHATFHEIRALINSTTSPSARVLQHPAIAGWFSDTRTGAALRRADPLRWIHLDGERPARWPTWADSSVLLADEDAKGPHPLLATIAVDDEVRSHTWEALARGAQGVLWQVDGDHSALSALTDTVRALSDAIRVVSPLLCDGTRTRLDLGDGVTGASWSRQGRRVLVVVNRRDQPATVTIPQARGLHPLEQAGAIDLAPDQTSVELPAGTALVLHGEVSNKSTSAP